MVTKDVDIWVTFGETLVALGVDFTAVELVFVETPGVDILEMAVVFTGTDVMFLGTTEMEVVGGFTVLLLDSLMWLEVTFWILSVVV